MASRVAAMTFKPKSTPELVLEVEEAHREAELTLGLGEAILQEARETRQRVERRIRQMVEGLPVEQMSAQD
jgi:hypothetical protein